MKALRATLKTFAVLVGGWGVLALVGFFAGVLPIRGLPFSAAQFEGGELDGSAPRDAAFDDAGGELGAAPADAGVFDVGPAVAETAPEPVPEQPITPERPPEGSAPPRLTRERWTVCAEPATPPSLAALDLVGDARAEIAVGCGSSWEVFAIDPTTLAPSRVAQIEVPPVPAELEPASGEALAVDVDGDGMRDLVLPLARYGPGSVTRGGGLYLVPRDRYGGFDPPRSLAPIAAVAVAASRIDGDAQPDLAVMHLANSFTRLPSEVWVFSGGASPLRRAVLRTGTGGASTAVVDLDRDGLVDVIAAAADDGRVDVFFGDGAGGFPRRTTFSIPNPIAMAVGDLDGDGADDAVIESVTEPTVESGGPVWIRAERAAALEVRPIRGASAGMRGIQAIEIDGDPAQELVGWDHPRLVVVDPADDGAEVRTLLELAAGDFGPRRHVVAQLDGEGPPEFVLLGVAAKEGGRALELLIVPGTERGIVIAGTGRPIPDAPLVLRVPLPDADRP